MVVHALTAKEFANKLLEHIVDPLIALMAFIALLWLVIVVIRIIANPDSNNRPAMFKQLIWSVVGVFVIFSIWTIITFVGRLAESNITPSLQEEKVYFRDFEPLTP